ncbi:MAG: peptidase C39-like protein [Patescibacteria group bacterium]|nr:peptidase C39-like protein [Patescibacteria group bacterium]
MVPFSVKSGMLLAVALTATSSLAYAGVKAYEIPTVLAAHPSDYSDGVEWKSDVALEFSGPVREDTTSPSITPHIDGQWSYENPVLGENYFKRIVFKPATYFAPGQEYQIKVSGISSLVGRGEAEYTHTFKAQEIPTVERLSVPEDATDIGICDPISTFLNGQNNQLAEFTFELDPPANLKTTPSEDGKSYESTVEGCLQQSTKYTLSLFRKALVEGVETAPELIKKQSFLTRDAPGIESVSPSGMMIVPGKEKIEVVFTQQMDEAGALPFLELSPPVKGSWKFSSPTTAHFEAAEKLAFDTSYQVIVKKGALSSRKGFITEDKSGAFSTIGPVQVSSITPRNGASGVSVSTSIKVTFDQEVDHASAEKAFSMSPQVNGTFSWSGRTMSFQPEGLEKDGGYAVSIKPGIASVEGLSSLKAYSASFSTEQSVTMLSIPVYFQARPLSCEVASLKMALGYRGISVGEDELLSQVGYDTESAREGNIWGDPDKGFVGNVNGRQNTTGYGVHRGPIARVASQYRSSTAFSGWGITELTSALEKGNPVVMWGVFPGSTRDSWETPEGKTISTWRGEHVRTVIGFKGKASNPTHIIMNDPISGRLTWDVGTYMANWATFQNSGVVVY